MNRLGSAALLVLSVLLLGASGNQGTKSAAGSMECDDKMAEAACDSKTQRDLRAAIKNNPKECSYEPDWRPTNSEESTLHVEQLSGETALISFNGETLSIHTDDSSDNACRGSEGKGCSLWKPEVGKDYPATMTSQPEYLNGCLHRVLRPKREVCIGSGKIVEEKLPHGVSRTAEFTTCYSLPTMRRDR
jgi:hypothetical protein